MENKNGKKRIFNILSVGKEPKKSSCCGNFEIEEIPEVENKKVTKNSCCSDWKVEEITDETKES